MQRRDGFRGKWRNKTAFFATARSLETAEMPIWSCGMTSSTEQALVSLRGMKKKMKPWRRWTSPNDGDVARLGRAAGGTNQQGTKS